MRVCSTFPAGASEPCYDRMRVSERKTSLSNFEVGDRVMAVRVHKPGALPKIVLTLTRPRKVASHTGEQCAYIWCFGCSYGTAKTRTVAWMSPYASQIAGHSYGAAGGPRDSQEPREFVMEAIRAITLGTDSERWIVQVNRWNTRRGSEC